MENDSEMKLIENLKSNNSNEVYGALLKVRKCYVRNEVKMKKIQKHSMIELIVPFLEHPKYCSISLSIIADCCLELSFVTEFIKCDGIKSLMRIMKSLVNDDVQNRACRALGNISKFDVGFKAVHLMNPVFSIINFLTETDNVNCQQTAIRTIMILGKTPKTRELIERENGIISIAKLLNSSNRDVLVCSIKALSNLTKNCSIFCARQLLELQFHKVIVELYSHSEVTVRNHALVSLKNLSMLEEIRSGLVKVGTIKLFTEVLSKNDSHAMSLLAAFGLCSCLDHIHMWSHNGTDRAVGLKALLSTLQNKNFKNIHLHVISSIIPLSYESKVTEILLSLDLLSILIQVLSSFIDKHKCTFKSSFSPQNIILAGAIRNKEYEGEITELKFQLPEIDFSLSKEVKENKSNFFNGNSIKDIWGVYDKPADYHYNTKLEPFFKSSTSDYSSSSSPSRIYSPISKLSSSPEVYHELDLGSPSGHSSSGVWSPTSLAGQYSLPYATCWSPVVTTNSNSLTPEQDILLDDFSNDEGSRLPSSPTNCTFSSLSSTNRDNSSDVEMSSPMSCNILMASESSIVLGEELQQKFKRKNDINERSDSSETLNSSKKVKSQNSTDTECSKIFSQVSTATVHKNEVLKSDKAKNSNTNHHFNSKLFSENTEKEAIDHYILLFILQLSFHSEKKPNSPVADKSCFSVLIDYLCFIHNPSPKAETILINLIKNRYCFEKLIINGFVSDVEEKMASSNYSCAHRSCVNLFYLNLLNLGKQEAESDFGIGTLAHILVTSEKMGQLHALYAMSKLITEKAALYRLLFQANGLSLLLNFLSDSCIITRRRSILSLCELYQSLVKEQTREKCCVSGTCSMKTSKNCSYKNSFYNVTFSVDSGAEILANREKLCENSEYFSALLDGHFLETNAKCVSMSDISAENLSTIFHFLHGCGADACCLYVNRIPFSVLLELLSNCDRFLLSNIKAFVEDKLCHRLFPSTVPKIYRKSKIHNSPALTKRSLDFVLSMNIVQKDTLWNCFEELISLELNLDFLGDIESLIKNTF